MDPANTPLAVGEWAAIGEAALAHPRKQAGRTSCASALTILESAHVSIGLVAELYLMLAEFRFE